MDCKNINILSEDFGIKIKLLKFFIMKALSQKPRKM